MEQPTQLRYQEIPENKVRSRGITSWTAMDLWVFGMAWLLMVAGLLWAHSSGFGWNGGMVTALFIGVFTLPWSIKFNKSRGRLYMMFWKGLKSGYLVLVLKCVLWVADDTSGWLVRWLRSRITAIPLKLGLVSGEIEGKPYRFTLIHQTDRPLDHLIIVGDGSDISTYDADRQLRANDTLAAILNQTIAQSDLKCGISYNLITGPWDEADSWNYYAHNMDPTVARPEAFELEDASKSLIEWLRKDMDQLMPVAKSFGVSKKWSVIVISIRRDRHWRAATKGKVDGDKLYNLPILELGRDLIDGLNESTELNLVNIHNPGLAELGCLIRCSWDVTGISQYYTDRAKGKIPRTDEQIDAYIAEHPDADIAELLQCWPQHIVRVADNGEMLQMDDNWIQVARAVTLPERVRADQFAGFHLLAPKGSWTRNAMVGESVSGSVETKSSIYGVSVLTNFNRAVSGNRVIENPNVGRRKRKLKNQIDQISLNSVAQHFNMTRCVISGDQRTTVHQMKKLRASLQSRGCKSEVIDLQAEQVDAMITACLAINRL